MTNSLRRSIKVGCCGFPRGVKSYFTHFKVVEVQQTFYKPPALATALKWREEAPEIFEFALKAWLGTREIAQALKARKAVILCAERFPWRCHRRFITAES